ncbi:hypothetical protein WJX72_011258 [[Myrmecia] bisecta]|uniref:Uncharacterized protein n=1 Tax=[Myrmecia] bisecta TaxID=41462 RepID=A0AAW1PMJ1_9CHLO
MDAQEGDLYGALEQFEAHRKERVHFRALDVAAKIDPEALVGRRMRVYWPDDDGWFLGTATEYFPDTGKHKIEYIDGDVEVVWVAMEQIRLLMYAGEVLVPPTSAKLHDIARCLLKAAEELEAADAGKRDAMQQRGYDLHEKAGLLQLQEQTAVVWARSPGWPDWPAIVITPEEADASGVKKAGRDSIPVHWFGTMEFGRVKPEHLTLFRDGLDAGMHRVAGNRNRRLRAACYEVRIYFESGELPAKMVPINNDDPDYDDEDEDDVPARSSAKKAKVASSAPGDVKLPVRLSDALSVHSLGRIEYIHPAFHNEKNFWPVGFSAVRMAATPASANKRVAHRCEILEAADGSGPLFRVTPEGLPAVEAATATKAWAALYASEAGDNGSASMRSLGIAGVRIFGLANPRIMRLLQRLEGANKCERYCSWEGEPPELVPLTPAEQRQRAAALAAMQQLPEGIAAVRAHNSAEGFCHVCAREDEIDGNHLLQCDACRAFVHMDCYGVEEQPNGSLWLCDVCKLGIKQAPACCLCPVQGGLLKPTSCGRWCHVACALWMPETHVEEEGSGAVAGIQQISKARFQLKCSICEQQHGACIQCAGSRACFTAFHPLCARNAGLPMATSPSRDPKAAHASTAEPPAKRQRTRSDQRRRRKGNGRWQSSLLDEGTDIGAGCRLMCFCAKHRSAAAETWPLRVTCGKSDIHGWGAFSKRALAKGDMVLEYVGELVRPSIADAREKRLYNSMVGAGTYVFRMSDAECVDATRKGNLAHLLNHSCDPNCYSRTITVQDKRSGRTHDHVVICAKKDIPAMQELTYDYRFCGDEQLPCNCGAATCRGHVNEKARPVQHEELVPRHRLKPYNAKKAAAKLQTAG